MPAIRRDTGTPGRTVGRTSNEVKVTTPKSLKEQIPPDWRKALAGEFDKPYFKELEKFLAEERKTHSVLPPADKVFAALAHTPLDKVKVVLIGQDPYPTKGNANGLSFSVEKGMPIPGSLRNMLKVAETDVGAKYPNNGDLTPWADQGVLLLNTVLTVREGLPNSHRDHGWEMFTRAILDVVNKKQQPVAFMLLGKQAQEFGAGVDTTRHTVVNAPHPSPAAPGNPFGKTHPFSDVNKALTKAGEKPINWQLPNR
ncbi:MAG: uracil-DNA glycosylase [Myxococcaceae bacterium]